MKVRFTAFLTVLALFAGVSVGAAQVQTGDINGRVADNTGAVLPGVTVTATSPALISPLVAVTSATGTYSFPRVPIGTYTIRFELPGFSTLVRENVVVTIGFNATINADLQISSVQETVTVSGQSPVVDTKNTTQQTTFDLESLQSIPSARDPWVMLERTPGIAMDRVNVGGTQSGQQSGYISRGAGSGNNKWSLDGVDITDMSATGASPIYYDFDMLQEMQVTTGGADASQQTGGVGINFVSKSGTNVFKGSGRFYVTDEQFQGDNLTDEIKLDGAGSGAPIKNIKDMGLEAGGPILRDKLWFWGSYGRSDINTGLVGFYLPTETCQGIKAALEDDPLANISTDDQRQCLGNDGTLLNNYNWKLTWSPVSNNRFNFQNTWAEKSKNARGASDTRPLETTQQQRAVSSDFGTFGWETGPSPIWKMGDQHVFTDRFLLDVQAGHVGNNFTLTFQEDAQRGIQPINELSDGSWQRSFSESIFLRPTDSVDVTASYFVPAALGGDHALKIGYRWRNARGDSISHFGGNAVARYDEGEAVEAQFYRDGNTSYLLKTQALYVQDTYTRNRLTLNLGLRWDRQTDEALATEVPANPLIPSIMPAISFPGASHDVVWNDISPRLGLNYDVFGTGRTVARTSYAMYFGQMGPGQLAGNLVSIGQVFVRYPWTDTNGDTFVQVDEVDFTRLLSRSGTFDPTNPANFNSPNTIDPDVKNDRTREFIVGFDHELMPGVGVGASYIWRKYDQFAWNDNPRIDSSDYTAVTFTPSCDADGARCESVTYYQPNFVPPTGTIYTNQPDRYRNFNGIELTLDKRYSNRWMANASFAYNDAKDYWDSPAAYQDPTNIEQLHGAEFAPESGGSGIDNVFTNAKWLVKASGMYTLPWAGINIAANTQYRQGYPFPQAIRTPARRNQAGRVNVLLDPMGDVRLENVFTLDLRIDKAFQIGKLRLVPQVDMFNATNTNAILARRRLQTDDDANNISGIVAPRVIRFGVRASW